MVDNPAGWPLMANPNALPASGNGNGDILLFTIITMSPFCFPQNRKQYFPGEFLQGELLKQR